MAEKRATASDCMLWSLEFSHFNRISFKFHIWIASIKVSLKFVYGFCQTNDNPHVDGRYNGHHLSVCTLWSLIHFNRASSKFHLWVAFMSFKFEFGFCPTNDNQIGRQIVRPLSVCMCGHSILLYSHFNRISSKFHIWIASIILSPKFEYGFCPTNDYKDGRQNGRRLSVCNCGQAKLVIYYPIASYEGRFLCS